MNLPIVKIESKAEPDTGWFIPLDLNTSRHIIVEAASGDVSNVTQADAWLSPLCD